MAEKLSLSNSNERKHMRGYLQVNTGHIFKPEGIKGFQEVGVFLREV